MVIPAIAVAAPMGEGSAATGNESITIVVNDTNATAANQTAGNQTMDNQTMGNVTNQTMGNQTGNMTLVAMINQDQNLSILAQAINATNLTGALQTGGPYTIFAPNDAAFEALGNETINQLLNNTDQLAAILQYHVVEGNYTSEQLLNMTQNQTQNQTANMTQNQTQN
ncbi:fasciclin domain-containing protein, partial [Methanoculleus taiwanensis]|uniref:fasciclin domain-containing protein n=1 Tax=Methanoculleus taiwanensis TaxID=1550565 RepID=UPI001F4F284F